MKSAKADEIFGFASDEIKSTHPASSRISSPKGISSSKTIYPTRKGGFSCKKSLVFRQGSFCWRREWDSNPRGREPKRFSRPPRYDRFDIPPCYGGISKWHACLAASESATERSALPNILPYYTIKLYPQSTERSFAKQAMTGIALPKSLFRNLRII